MTIVDGALFNRSWAVTIGLPGQTGKQYSSIVDPKTGISRGLRITFNIEKTSEPSANKSKIEMYNLSTDSIAQFQKGMQIRVDAGYQNINETLYIADIVRTTTKRTNQEVVTTFECGDAERQLILSNFDKSYGAGTSNITVLQDLATAMGVQIGPVIGLTKVVYNGGVSFSGSARKALETLTKNMNVEFSIHNGALQIIPLTAHNGEEAIVLRQDTGLIGIPSQGDGFVQFSALLNPKISPTSLVQIVSKAPLLGVPSKDFPLGVPTNAGFFKVRKCSIEGDTHGDKWDMNCEAVPISANQVENMNQGSNFNTAVNSK